MDKLTLTIHGRLPLWNAILAMHHWKRKKFKDAQMADFLFALQACAEDWQMRTGCVKNTFSIAADTLASYQTIRQNCAKLKRANAKPRKARKSTR